MELLWRRAEGDALEVLSGKLYTLVSAELLDYDVSRRVEESLEKYSHGVPGEFTSTDSQIITQPRDKSCKKTQNN